MRVITASAAIGAALGALTACSLFTSFDDLSSGDGRPFNGSEGGGTDAGTGDAPTETSAPGLDCDDPDVVLWWSFDEADGTVAFDCGPLKINGIFSGAQGAVAWGERNGGGALEISGSGEVRVQPRSELDPPGAMTVAAFVRSDQNPSGYLGLPYHLGSTSGGRVYGWEISLDRTGRLYAALGFGEEMAAVNFPPLVPGRWTHLAFVYDLGSSLEIYVDGRSIAKVTSLKDGDPIPPTGVTPSPSSPLHIGVKNDDTWKGALDDVLVFRRALTAAEVAALAAR